MYSVIRIKNWGEAKTTFSRLDNWIFRGHADTHWGLKTTIERAAERYKMDSMVLDSQEKYLLRSFQRRAHHYYSDPPATQDAIEWLALIQHHGGPTRLLDFTFSYYIASFFAMEKAEGDCAVWCIHQPFLDMKTLHKKIESFHFIGYEFNDKKSEIAKEMLSQDSNTTRIFRGEQPLKNEKMVLSVEPNRMNERMSHQKGIFLMPFDITLPFEANLSSTLEFSFTQFDEKNATILKPSDLEKYELLHEHSIIKIVIPREVCPEGMFDLYNMNITAESLFPGLDGFARSLDLAMRQYEQATDQ